MRELGLKVGAWTVNTTNDSALFWGPAGAFQVLAREGDPVPTLTGGEVYGAMVTSNQDFLLNALGQTVFRNTLLVGTGGVTTANDGIVMYGLPSSLQVLAREGTAWNGAGAAGEILDRYNANTTSPVTSMNLNEVGHVLHDVHFIVPSGSATSTANFSAA